MTFDDALKIIKSEKFGTTIKDETPRHSGDPDKFDFVISDNGIGTGIEKIINLITELKEEYETKDTKFEYAIQRSIMSNSKSLDALRNLLAKGYKIIDKSVLNSGNGDEDYIEYVLSREKS